MEQLRKHPLGMAGEGFKAFADGGRLGGILSTLAGVLPSEALRRWLRRGTRMLLLWKLASKFWSSLSSLADVPASASGLNIYIAGTAGI
jgi:hypothetical protein